MCGIVGVTHPDDFPYLRGMATQIEHRGPDDYGEYVDTDAGMALAMRRLSIVDLAGGRQPMANEDMSVWVVFNGEIYNAPALRRRLIARGHRFRTNHSDTEVLVHLYEEKASAMLDDLNGIFAFAIFDRNQRRLFCARDRAGVKPFYYAYRAGRLAFASELKCLRLLPWIAGELNLQSLYDYVSLQFVPAPDTIYRDVQKLPAGFYLDYHLTTGHCTVRRYWRLQPRAERNRSLKDWCLALRAKLSEAVARQTLSDVPIACSLSGGLDSSALVGLLSQHQDRPVKTYTLGFTGANEEGYNELPLARAVARRWGSEHKEVCINPDCLLLDLGRMVWHLDEPYGGGLPSWYVFELIGRDCKVAMTGTGGDELFGNYAKWRLHERPGWYRTLRSVRDLWRWGQPRELRDRLRYPHGHFYHRYLADAVKDGLVFTRDVAANCAPTEALLERLWTNVGKEASARDCVAVVDFQLQLPEEFLAVTDRFSMAHGVEARVPFLDHELVELVFAVPPEVRTHVADPKYLLRRVVADLLPAELLAAPKKGFILPLPLWTRGRLRDLIGDLLGPAALQQQGWFAPSLWHRLVAPHLAGTRDFTQQVWTLLMFQLWHQNATGGFATSASTRNGQQFREAA